MYETYIKQIIPAPENMHVIFNIDGVEYSDKIVCLALLSNDLIVYMSTDESGEIHEVDTDHEQFVRIVYK